MQDNLQEDLFVTEFGKEQGSQGLDWHEPIQKSAHFSISWGQVREMSEKKECESILEGFEEDSTLHLEGQIGHKREISLF